jgi:hypothetical protein
MNWKNEFDFEPGTYQHYKGGIYVVTNIVTHMDNPEGAMDALADPLVVYRDLIPIVKHVQGKPMAAHQVYARTLSEFTEMVTHNNESVKRFTKI